MIKDVNSKEKIMKVIDKFGYLNLDMISDLLNKKRENVKKQVLELEREKLLIPKFIDKGEKIVCLSTKGKKLIESTSGFNYRNKNFTLLKHQKILARWIGKNNFSPEQYTTDIENKRWSELKGKTFKQKMSDMQNGWFPDAIVYLPDKTIYVEVERTYKPKEKLKAKMVNYKRNQAIFTKKVNEKAIEIDNEELIFVTENKSLADHIKRNLEFFNLGNLKNIKFELLE